MPELNIKWPEKDLKAIADQIERAQLNLGKTLEGAVIWAGILVAKSAAAKTKKAPRQRKVFKNAGDKRALLGGKMRIVSPKLFPYYREVWEDGPNKIKYWFMKDRSDPKFKFISRAGLAKKSWLWMITGIKGNGMSNFASEVEKHGTAFTFELVLSNMLKYINDAIEENDGAALLNIALGKAAKVMEKSIDCKLGLLTK